MPRYLRGFLCRRQARRPARSSSVRVNVSSVVQTIVRSSVTFSPPHRRKIRPRSRNGSPTSRSSASISAKRSRARSLCEIVFSFCIFHLRGLTKEYRMDIISMSRSSNPCEEAEHLHRHGTALSCYSRGIFHFKKRKSFLIFEWLICFFIFTSP